MLLYVVTDRSWLGASRLEDQVEDILRAGATFLQIREKELDDAAFLKQTRKLKAIAARYQVPFVVNDNVDIALAADADGVHVGQEDQNATEVRRRIGPDKILGVSAQTVEQALRAQNQGADYIGVGAVFSTATKSDAVEVRYGTLRAICDAVTIPVVAIGGIHAGNILALKGSGVDGVAVISAILAAKDPASATRTLLALAKEMVK